MPGKQRFKFMAGITLAFLFLSVAPALVAGDTDRKQTSARTCVVNGTGGSLSTTSTLVLMADD